MFRFTIRDVLWAMVVVGVFLGWHADIALKKLDCSESHEHLTWEIEMMRKAVASAGFEFNIDAEWTLKPTQK